MARMYDAMFVFLTSLKDEALEAILDRIGSEVEKLGGKVLKTDALGRRSFARPMAKQESGLYYKLRLELDADRVDALLARLKLVDDVFRLQIVKAEPEPVQPVAEEKTEVKPADAPAVAGAPAEDKPDA